MKPTAVLFVSLCLDLIAFTIFLPLQPKLLSHYVAQDPADGLLHSALQAVGWWKHATSAASATTPKLDIIILGGFLGSLLSFLGFLTSPLYGSLSDRFGRKPLLLVSAVGTVIAYYTWVTAANFEAFLFSRFILGAFKCNVNIWSSVAADVSSQQDRAGKMAILGIAFAFSFTVGPLFGAILLNLNPPEFINALLPDASINPCAFPSAVATVLAVLDTVFLLACFKETLPPASATPTKSKLSLGINPFSMLSISKTGAAETVVRKIVMIHLMFLICFSGVEYTLGFLTWDRFGFTHKDLGTMYLVIGLVMALTSGGYVRRKRNKAQQTADPVLIRKTIRKMVFSGMVMLVPGWLLLAWSHNLWVFYIGILTMGASSGIVVNCLQALISTYGSADQQGLLLGYTRSYGALGRAIGPFLFCALYWQVGSFVCHVLAVVVLLVPIYMLTTLKKYDNQK
eukprot:TRINITY_DN59084_c0_g1_i1.p1 TRINITY_DN59084_c0_g1~~TRINITY_DN59084_c0_g1_i1.p1  ORF type:complete len:455 (-),score=23.02 TRINITY_DN59084_c0_g1_i1:1173-2537(-)